MFYGIVIIIALCLAEFFLEYILFSRYNQKPLNIKTFEGSSDQPYHPSVLFFKEGWNGYKYWMVETPYPIGALPYRDRWECPTIHVSNDGVNWNSPSDPLRPIDDLEEKEIEEKDFFSDPHLVYREGRIECFYRFSKKIETGYHTYLLRKTSEDGLSWSNRETLLDFMSEESLSSVGDMVRSPAIIYENGEYVMWYVDTLDPNGNKNVCLSTSQDGYHWSSRKRCSLIGKGINPWHIDVAKIGNQYILTIYDFRDITIWQGEEKNIFNYKKTLLSPSYLLGCFYSEGLYRTSLIKDNNGLKLYFSAFDREKTYIGLMEGNNVDNLKIADYSGKRVKLSQFLPSFLWICRLQK